MIRIWQKSSSPYWINPNTDPFPEQYFLKSPVWPRRDSKTKEALEELLAKYVNINIRLLASKVFRELGRFEGMFWPVSIWIKHERKPYEIPYNLVSKSKVSCKISNRMKKDAFIVEARKQQEMLETSILERKTKRDQKKISLKAWSPESLRWFQLIAVVMDNQKVQRLNSMKNWRFPCLYSSWSGG